MDSLRVVLPLVAGVLAIEGAIFIGGTTAPRMVRMFGAAESITGSAAMVWGGWSALQFAEQTATFGFEPAVATLVLTGISIHLGVGALLLLGPLGRCIPGEAMRQRFAEANCRLAVSRTLVGVAALALAAWNLAFLIAS